jgi:tetratricopeptide (TPR) repeat protein
VRRRIGLTLPNQIDVDPVITSVPWLARFGWSVASSLRALMSLPAIPGATEPYFVAALALLFAVAGAFLLGREARARLRRAAPWIALGLAWFLAFCAIQVTIYPIRGPYRSVFGGVGLGIAAVAVLGATRPALVAALVAIRLVAFALSPGPPARISNLPPETGAFVDFERVVRLQHLMADTRSALRSRFPTLPPHARVGQHHMPRSALYAFGGNQALQLWYRDSTLSWMSFGDFTGAPETRLATIVEYQPHRAPQIALVEPDAMRALLAALSHFRAGARDSVLAALDRADALQRDRAASVFLSTLEAKRALCLLDLGRRDEAGAQARIALREWPANFDSRYVLARLAFDAGRLAEAEAQLDTLLATHPDDAGAIELLQRVRSARGSPSAPR